MQFRQKIEAIINPVVYLLEESFAEAEQLVKNKQVEYRDLSTSYTELLADLTAINDKISKDKEDVARGLGKINADRLQLESDRNNFITEAEKIHTELIEKRDAIELLKKEIEERKSELKTITVLTKQKDVLIAELSKINSELSFKSTQMKEVESKLDIAVKNTNAEINRLSTLNKDIEEALSARTTKVLEREQIVASKEKKLLEKEEDLRTIEGRWKKLYESKGAGFKI